MKEVCDIFNVLNDLQQLIDHFYFSGQQKILGYDESIFFDLHPQKTISEKNKIDEKINFLHNFFYKNGYFEQLLIIEEIQNSFFLAKRNFDSVTDKNFLLFCDYIRYALVDISSSLKKGYFLINHNLQKSSYD